MGILGKIFGAQRPIYESKEILFSTLPLGRNCSIVEYMRIIQKADPIDYVGKYDPERMDRRMSKCSEYFTSLQLYNIINFLPKYIKNDEIINDVINSIAFQYFRFNKKKGEEIIDEFIKIYKEIGNSKTPEQTMVIKSKILLRILDILTEETPIKKENLVETISFKRLIPDLESIFLDEFFVFQNNTFSIIEAAFDKKTISVPVHIVIENISEMIIKKYDRDLC